MWDFTTRRSRECRKLNASRDGAIIARTYAEYSFLHTWIWLGASLHQLVMSGLSTILIFYLKLEVSPKFQDQWIRISHEIKNNNHDYALFLRKCWQNKTAKYKNKRSIQIFMVSWYPTGQTVEYKKRILEWIKKVIWCEQSSCCIIM